MVCRGEVIVYRYYDACGVGIESGCSWCKGKQYSHFSAYETVGAAWCWMWTFFAMGRDLVDDIVDAN